MSSQVVDLAGLALAKYVLKRLMEDGGTIERLRPDFEGDDRYILGIISFLKEIGWLIEDEQSGKYLITDKGHFRSAEVSK